MKTWQVELAVVAVALGATLIATGGGIREAVGSCAVLATFAHGQVSDRLAEHARLSESITRDNERWRWAVTDFAPSKAHCWRWARRYYVTKELLWLGYFLSLHAWSALVGVVVFLLYPLWRAFHRRTA